MIILAMDTALGACSAALLDARVSPPDCASRFEQRAKGHAEVLAPMVDDLLRETGLEPGDIDRLAVTIGPGAFTGVRIALSFARALALTLSKPVIGITSLEAIALNHWLENPGTGPLVVAIDARREEIYTQTFAAPGKPLTEPALLPIETVAQAIQDGAVLIGTGAALLHEALDAHAIAARISPALAFPDAACIADWALTQPPPAHKAPPGPLYLRAPDAKLPQKPPLILS